MGHIQRVTRPRIVDIVSRIGRQTIIRCVIDAFERQRRPTLVALGRVVVDNIQDHLDPSIVEAGDHLLELADGPRRGDSAARARRTRSNYSPRSSAAPLQQVPVIKEGMDRQQLDRRDADAADVIDNVLVRQSGVSALQLRRHGRVPHRVSADMGLVENRAFPWNARRLGIAPGESRIDHPALRHACGAVAPVERQVVARRADPVAEMGIGPAHMADQRLGVGVEQKLVGIEAVTGSRLIRSMDAVAIHGSRPRIGQIAVPDLVGIFRQNHPLQLAPAVPIEQAQLDLGGVSGEESEVHSQAIPGSAQGKGKTFLYT